MTLHGVERTQNANAAHTGPILILLILGLVLGGLVSVPQGVEAAPATVTFTSTADFDGGTKSDPADGNYGVETVTDNGGVTAGSFELASGEGDEMTYADADADTFKWTGKASGTPTINTRDIAGGVLRLNGTRPTGAGNYRTLGVTSDFTLSGTIDVRAASTYVAISAAGTTWTWLGIGNEAVSDCQATGTEDGVWIRLASRNSLQTWSCVNGVLTQVGTSTTITATSFICYRIAGSSGAWTTYYQTTAGCAGAWTQDETPTTTVSGNLYVTLSTGVNTATAPYTWEYSMDSYVLASGTVNAGGYRTTGAWTSATQAAISGEYVSSATLTFSGVSSTYYIDQVRILDSGGAALATDGTDRTSGTSSVSIFEYAPFLADVAWRVEVTLAGDGAGTPVLESVQVDSSANPVPPDSGGAGSPRLRLRCSYWVAVLTCTDETSYRGYRNLSHIEVSVDGRAAVRAPPGGTVALALPLDVRKLEGDVVVRLTVVFSGGGRPSSAWVYHLDNLPVWTLGGVLVVLALGAAVASLRGRAGRAVRYERLVSVPYRGAKIEEYPPGWRTYRVRKPDAYGRVASRRRGNLIVVYGLRPATDAERGRSRLRWVGEIVEVREKV